MAIGGYLCSLLRSKISKGKRHGQPLTESIRFKVTLEVKVSKVKKELGPSFEVPAYIMDVTDVKT